jgi:hypothetical protein
VQIDSILYNDIGEDVSWDAVWESATKIVADGWVAESAMPFSQLRFPDKPSTVWELNITRRTDAEQRVGAHRQHAARARRDSSRTSPTSTASRHSPRTAAASSSVAVAAHRPPLAPDEAIPSRSRAHKRRRGLDLKYAMTSSLTLTGTINPDFGQVEVDPAVVNLSQFERSIREAAVLHGRLNIFNFGDSPAAQSLNFFFPPRMFYSRRIGRSPQAASTRSSSPVQPKRRSSARRR